MKLHIRPDLHYEYIGDLHLKDAVLSLMKENRRMKLLEESGKIKISCEELSEAGERKMRVKVKTFEIALFREVK